MINFDEIKIKLFGQYYYFWISLWFFLCFHFQSLMAGVFQRSDSWCLTLFVHSSKFEHLSMKDVYCYLFHEINIYEALPFTFITDSSLSLENYTKLIYLSSFLKSIFCLRSDILKSTLCCHEGYTFRVDLMYCVFCIWYSTLKII